MDPEDSDAMAYVEGWKWEYEPVWTRFLTSAREDEEFAVAAVADEVMEGFQYDVSPL
jgi:hypothetical protein